MRRVRFLASLIVCALPVSGATEPREIGRLAQKEKLVWEEPPDKVRKEMREKSPVKENYKVDTGRRSAAKFTIGKRQGGLLMGPKSSFEFLGSRFDEDGFVLRVLDLRLHWGILHYISTPPRKDPTEEVLEAAPGEVRIYTPGGPIKLLGTDVYIHVDRKSGATTVYVAEGAAEVQTDPGVPGLRVEAGHWTYVAPGRPPLPPRPWVPKAGPGGGGAALGVPDDWLLPGPLLIDLNRLDLPRIGPR